MPTKPTDPTRKIVAVTIHAEEHKHLRMFAAMNDLTHEKVIGLALSNLARSYPGYELGLATESRVVSPPFRTPTTKAKRQAAE